MHDYQASDQTASCDSQMQRTPRDSQICSIAQLGGSDAGPASFTANAANEPEHGQLDLQSMFGGSSLFSALGLSGDAGSQAGSTDFMSLGSEFQKLGAEFSAVGQDLTTLAQDLSAVTRDLAQMGTDFPSLLNSSESSGSMPTNNPSTCTTGSDTGAGSDGTTTSPPGEIGNSTPASGDSGSPASPAGDSGGPTLPAGGSDSPTPPPAVPAGTETAPGSRTAADYPFSSTSVFNLPIGSGAQWAANDQLSSASGWINLASGGWNQPIYQASAADPVYTIQGATDGRGNTLPDFQLHIPAGAQAATQTDGHLNVLDGNQLYSFYQFKYTGENTATASFAEQDNALGDGLAGTNSDYDYAVGTITSYDLNQGSIDHMLRVSIPTTMALSVGSSPDELAPYAWPQTKEDYYGPQMYTGTVPYGATIGIPNGTPEPASVAANPGAHMLWKALSYHGAMIRDTGGSGNNVIFYADQTVADSNPLVQQMNEAMAQIIPYTRILTNQGPNSINGGGTPLIPLDPEISA